MWLFFFYIAGSRKSLLFLFLIKRSDTGWKFASFILILWGCHFAGLDCPLVKVHKDILTLHIWLAWQSYYLFLIVNFIKIELVINAFFVWRIIFNLYLLIWNWIRPFLIFFIALSLIMLDFLAFLILILVFYN